MFFCSTHLSSQFFMYTEYETTSINFGRVIDQEGNIRSVEILKMTQVWNIILRLILKVFLPDTPCIQVVHVCKM
jgi:hypothetical protein